MRANLKEISHRGHIFEVASVWELTKGTIHLPLGCLQGGSGSAMELQEGAVVPAKLISHKVFIN